MLPFGQKNAIQIIFYTNKATNKLYSYLTTNGKFSGEGFIKVGQNEQAQSEKMFLIKQLISRLLSVTVEKVLMTAVNMALGPL